MSGATSASKAKTRSEAIADARFRLPGDVASGRHRSPANRRGLFVFHTWGVVTGAGLKRRFGPLRLTPEVRFTRWADRNFGVHHAPLRSNSQSGGVSHRLRVLIDSNAY